ncbi:hypothetical protein D3C84_361450 [compost metagenome]
MQVELTGGVDLLQRLAVPFEKPRAQGFVALDQLLETAAQGVFIQFATQLQGTGNGVGAALRFQLPGNPQTVLRQRLRQCCVARQGLDGAQGLPAVLLLSCHCRGKCREGRGLEQQAQIQLQAQRLAQARHHLRGGDGVAAQQKEMIVGAHVLDVQMVAPDLADQAFKFRHRPRLASGGLIIAGELRVGVEAAIDLPAATRRAL